MRMTEAQSRRDLEGTFSRLPSKREQRIELIDLQRELLTEVDGLERPSPKKVEEFKITEQVMLPTIAVVENQMRTPP